MKIFTLMVIIYVELIKQEKKTKNSAPGGDRTHDLRVTRPASNWREAYQPVHVVPYKHEALTTRRLEPSNPM